MSTPVFALPGDFISFAEKILAILGGALVGALIVGVLVQLVVRSMTTQKMPRWMTLIVRLLGGLIGGGLVAWVLGFGGGSGFGGSGGWGLGTGSGKEGEPIAAKQERDVRHDSENNEAPSHETLRVEVLGKETLSEQDARTQRWYRLGSGDGARLLNFEEVKEEIRKRQQKQPPLSRIEIVLYNNSPEERLNIVRQLLEWGRNLNDGMMKVDIRKRDTDAPRNAP